MNDQCPECRNQGQYLGKVVICRRCWQNNAPTQDELPTYDVLAGKTTTLGSEIIPKRVTDEQVDEAIRSLDEAVLKLKKVVFRLDK